MTATITILSLPANNGSPITDIQYTINNGAFVSIGAASTGAYTIPAGDGDEVRIYAVNAQDRSFPSDVKALDLTAPTFDAPTYVASTQTLTIPSLSEGGTLVWATSVTGNTPTYSIAGSPPGTWGGDATHETGSVSGVTTLDTPTIPITDTTPDGTQNLRVYIYDAAGNLSAPFDVTITVDNTAPTVTFSPADDATGVSTTADLVMNFSKSMDTSASTTVTLKLDGGATIETYDSAVDGVWSTTTVADDTWEVTPSDPLPGSTSLAVQYSDFEDTFGNALPDATNDTTWNFSVSNVDVDAQNWIDSVETAEGTTLEQTVVDAVDTLVFDLKSAGVWAKRNLILIPAGPPTLAGAEKQLKGSVDAGLTNYSSGLYDRATGLSGNGTSSFMNTGYQIDTDSVTNVSYSVLVTEILGDSDDVFLSNESAGNVNNLLLIRKDLVRAQTTNTFSINLAGVEPSYICVARDNSSSAEVTVRGSTQTINETAGSHVDAGSLVVHKQHDLTIRGESRIAYVSAGEFLTQAERADEKAAVEAYTTAISGLT